MTAITATGRADEPFGATLVEAMSVARCERGEWSPPTLEPLRPFSLSPAAHVLHYGSACFEGLKAHRGVDGVVRVFRLDRHVERFRASAEALVLPPPPVELIERMITDVVRGSLDAVPDAPGSLYLRPTMIGTQADIGAAARPSAAVTLFVVASPVGDYFVGGPRPLVLAIETRASRTTPRFGEVKCGANYAMALGPTLRAAHELGADQLLFAPAGRVEETGASNFLLLDGERLVTPELTPSFLHGVTRDSLLQIAVDLGYSTEERPVTVEDVLTWARRPDGEAALSGTAAVLAPVGQLVHEGERVRVGTGEVGPNTARLRRALTEIHRAERPGPGGWLTPVFQEAASNTIGR